MGYGARAIQSLASFYGGELLNLDEVHDEVEEVSFAAAAKVDKVRPEAFRLYT